MKTFSQYTKAQVQQKNKINKDKKMKKIQNRIKHFSLALLIAAGSISGVLTVNNNTASAAPGPTGFTVTQDATTRAMTYSWNAVQDAVAYGVIVKQTNGNFVTNNGSTNTVWTVKLNNDPVPFDSITNTSVTVATPSEGGFASYYVRTYGSGGGGSTSSANLLGGTSYEFAVWYATTEPGAGFVPTNITEASSALTYVNINTPASAPRNFSVSQSVVSDKNTALLSWDPPLTTGGSSLAGYRPQIRVTGTSDWINIINEGVGITTDTSYTFYQYSVDVYQAPDVVYQLVSGTQYDVRIVPVNSPNGGYSASPNVASSSFTVAGGSQGGGEEEEEEEDEDEEEEGPTVPDTTLNLDGNLSSQAEQITSGQVASLNGRRGAVTVLGGGVLKGAGMANTVTITSGATLSPGNSPGTMTVLETYSSAGNLIIEILNKDSYDKLIVGENSTGPNAVILGTGATLSPSLYEGWSINEGDQFTIIDNVSDTPVDGIFPGKPEGAQFAVGLITFSISYVGGDGNDVVLTALSAAADPDVPNTGIAKIIFANPLTVVVLGVATAGLLLYLASRRRTE